MAESFKVGDVVARKSYNYDVLFKITNINGEIVDLVGTTVRIIADSPIYDLVHISKEEEEKRNKTIEMSRYSRMTRCYNNATKRSVFREDLKSFENPNYFQKDKLYRKPGIILHIDGDAEYAAKSRQLYKKMGLKAYVYNIAEQEQYKQVYQLLQKIRPNILVLTGHDAFMKRRNDIYNLDNYKNSKYYIQGVLEARRYEHNLDNLVIYAGACQSYYEALISAGANFASAPKRVLIDMMDPIIAAESIAYTPVEEFVSISNIIANTREGINGIGGIQTRGTYRTGMPGI